jgi:flagellar L-ring protein precursor FlgH
MKLGLRSLAAIIVFAAPLAGCGTSPQEFMRPPNLSPVGSGLVAQDDGAEPEATALNSARAPGPSRRQDLYTDQRIARVGDIVTVVISINDKATFGNTTDRSTTGVTAFQWQFGYTPPTSGSASSSGQPGTVLNNVNSTSNSQGQGDINRSEQIQVSVPAVVTQVMPNGNLMIRGSQEVRVNFEIRQLTVAGIVHPADIARNNTIAYDRVAEARISYGGRGRISEVQQPSWGQQIYDYLRPF